MSYDPKSIEQSIYTICKERGYFEIEGNANIAKSDKAFCLMMPPPNVTGVLHIGHALTFTLQDIITRFKRMDGFATLYQPGLDHAGIATQNVVEKQLLAQGLSKEQLGREAFLQKVWEWKEQSGGKIITQMQALGISPAWSRLRFTMDSGLQNAVREAFVAWYERGLIYQGDYMVNWCVKDGALSDIEVEYKEQETHLYHLRYPVADSNEVLLVATTRPETFFGDSAVMIHPSDTRYTHLLGKSVVLPLVGREIPIIADNAVDMEFGTGVVKVTPAHDENDYAVGKAHGLESIVIFDEKGVLNDYALGFAGRDRLEARADIVEALQQAGAVEKIEPYGNQVGVCYRCGSVIEPYISRQWFIDEGIARETIKKVNAQKDSASGNHSSDFVDFGATADRKSSSAPKSTKSTTSNTATPRICEEDNRAECEKSASSSSRADEIGVAIHKSTQVDSRGDYSASAESMDCHANASAFARNDRKNAIGEKADSSTAQNLSEQAKDSRIFTQNAPILNTPQARANLDSSKSPSDSKILEIESGFCEPRKEIRLERLSTQRGEAIHDSSPKAESTQAQKPTPMARFYPPQWLNNFNAWMRDLRPWCISRQLWWGHRIPVWYCQNSACGHIFASKNERESACPKCHSSVLQDPDVLDTWFSSGLWAFSTLGWGNGEACKELYDSNDLTRFYPNSLLITGFDILFFWVARMLFSGESLLGELPFRDVYLHALVRDEFGQKMSKSKGNVIDPLAMIEEYGADSLRFGLAYSCAQGRDVRLAKSQLELAKNFANKLYNAAQFLLLYARQADPNFSGFSELESINAYQSPLGRYAKSRLNSATKELRAALESYRFNDGASVAYRFLWGEFCDWCIELAKAQKEAICELGAVMIEAMKLLHPYMPFLTESLYHTLRGSALESSESIMITRYPSEVSQDSAIEQEYAYIKDAIVSLRRAKALIDLANKPIERAYIATDFRLSASALQAICKLAKVGAIECVDTKAQNGLDKDCVADIGSLIKSYLPLQGIDLAPIITRLNSQNLKLEKEINKLQALESNEKFKANAPKNVLESNASALAEAKAKQAEVLAQLAIFAQK
ncbi:valine--tRNA ligase [Helicobacter canis]|uniref:Valine--tRNA ligase n=1 Tax=Helicobacter canis TaxID=29419 RepID=A0A377J2L4_9HELI|nr:valine--tRNA ligase [Helicobacter canis]STO96742.1 valyl-tRNA synthetase [Helicobacter canis]